MTLCTRDKVVFQNSIEFAHGPSVHISPRCDSQIGTVIIANPFGQLGWKPAQNRMCRSVLIGCPLSAAIVTGQHLLAAQSKVCRKLSPRTSRLQQMNVQAYLALEPMKTAFATGSSAMRLCKYKKISYMYSYMNYNYNTQI
jgi:hypothetical protein